MKSLQEEFRMECRVCGGASYKFGADGIQRKCTACNGTGKSREYQELESLYDTWHEHLEALEEIRRLKHEDNEAELTEWAQNHGLQREQLKTIPCTEAIHNYIYRNWPEGTPNRAFYHGSTCEARFTVGEDLYCKAPRPFTEGYDEGQVTASLILEALKQNEGGELADDLT